jgi:hypothetical protein
MGFHMWHFRDQKGSRTLRLYEVLRVTVLPRAFPAKKLKLRLAEDEKVTELVQQTRDKIGNRNRT